MTTSGKSGRWKLGLASWLVISGAIAASCGESALAQITPDITLGDENSTVTSTGEIDSINGGATRGANLFHSFQEFNIDEGRAAVFTNPSGIENILTRVTGANPSNIFGTLGVAGGNANLFLINPNGIIFGSNARLDVGGSFVGTTANAIAFGNQGFFNATNPNTPELLTVNPSAFFFNQIAAAPIQNNSVADSGLNPSSEFTATGLRVPDGNSLLLVGGDINMDGGGLYAFGGRVELGGLAGAGTIGLNGDGNNLSLSFPDGVERSDVSLSNGSRVTVEADNGGSIAVNAQNLEMTDGSYLFAGIGLGSSSSKAGNIEVNATGAISLSDRSFINNRVLPEAKEQGGNVNINASTLRVEGGAQVSANTFSAGKGGNLTISANTLLVQDGAQVSANTYGAGDGGNLTVDAQDVKLIGRSADDGVASRLSASTRFGSTGNVGDLTISTNTLLIQDGAQVSANTYSAGKGGNLTVTADKVQLTGNTPDGKNASGMLATAEFGATGEAGNLTITTRELLLQDGAQVSAGTWGEKNGGELIVNATESVQMIGGLPTGGLGSSLNTKVFWTATGNGGNLKITTPTLQVLDGAEVAVESFGTGTVGNMTLNARSIRLDNNALLTANTRSTLVDPNREQATINIDNSRDLVLSRNSNIFTNATGESVVGGNININTDFLIAVDNSDISANSANFRGGNVRINAFGIFGTQFRDVASDRTSDITATGASPEFSGTVELNIPEVDPSQGLVSLPTVPVETEVAQVCTPGGSQAQSEFVVTGRGGLPPNPNEALSSDAISVDWVTLNPEIEDKSSPDVSTNPTAPEADTIVEAQGVGNWQKWRGSAYSLCAYRYTS